MVIQPYHKDLFLELLKADFKVRYQGSILGFVWVLLRPFLLFMIFYIIFSYIFSRGDSHFAIRLILGLIIFTYFSEATTHGLTSLINKADVILKVNFPRQIVVISSIVNSLLTLFFSFVIFIAFWVFNPTSVSALWLLFPVYLLVLSILITGLSFFLSVLSVKFRDMQMIWELFIQILFYGSAIFYPISILSPKLQEYMYWNPIFVIIQQCREILIDNTMPDLKFLFVISLASVAFFILGYVYFKRNIKRIAEYF
ncbi:ABC transporter permease [Patescibacteria group bacterium]|nr:ABC transporter permease [Patescibacteria group bacterium]